MNDRANILARLRRWKSGAARHVVASFAIAYLAAGVAPCAMAASPAPDEPSIAAHEDHAAHEPQHHSGAHAQHGDGAHAASGATHDSAPAPADQGNERCPHCLSGAQGDHATCVALEDLTNVAASHAKDAPKPLAPILASPALTLPLPFASPWPPPPLRAVRGISVPLNVRHCVFLI